MRYLRKTLVISAIAISLAACSNGSENTASTTSSPDSATVSSGGSASPQKGNPEASATNPQAGNQQFVQEIQVLEPLKSAKVGTTVKIPVVVKNTSNFVWENRGTNPVTFGYQWSDANGKIVVTNGDRTLLPQSLAPKDSTKLNATVKLPTTPGTYTLNLTMVQEMVAWFNQKGAESPKIPVTVTP